MIELEAKVFGDKEFVRALIGYPRALRLRLKQMMVKAGKEYARSVSAVELSGNPIKRGKTGKLARSMTVKVKEDSSEAVEVIVYPRAKYGWMLGQGSPKNETVVKQHARRVDRAAGQTAVITDTKRRGKGGMLYKTGKTLLVTGAVTVKQHTKKIGKARAPKPFMGPAFMRMHSVIEERLRKAPALATEDVKNIAMAPRLYSPQT